jgi:mediator of RNA polymerase II transcription subunit 14
VLREIISSVLMPSERVVRLDLSTRWEIGAAGIGGGLKVGDAIDSVLLPLVCLTRSL